MKTKATLRWLVTTITAAACGLGVALVAVERPTVHFSGVPAHAMSGSASMADVAGRVLPSVVNIASTRVAPAMSMDMFPFFRRPPGKQRGIGSGVIISEDGVVLTNNHVVAKADKILVTLSNKREFEAKVVGTDPKSDLAVLRLKGAKNLKALPVGNSDQMRLGDLVLAVGNPFGVGLTVTAGIISAVGRGNVGMVDYEDFIQTDAAINPGNSGGALVNMRGELIGINTAILSRSGGYQGIGFAIPSNMARPIAKSLLRSGKVVRGWLGVVIQPNDRALAKAMKLPTTNGVLISDIDPRGPAKRAGLQRGDLVLRINNKPVNSVRKLRNLVASAGAGSTIALQLLRSGKKLSMSVRLSELPARLGGTAGAERGTQQGLVVEPLTANNRNRYGISRNLGSGVVVTAVKPDSKAAEAGLRPGDVILEVNRARINSVRRFNQTYTAARGQVLLLVSRRGLSHYVLIHK